MWKYTYKVDLGAFSKNKENVRNMKLSRPP